MALAQRVATSLLPKRWASEAESRSWVLRCPCGHEAVVWEVGGIRYKAAGNPWRKGRRAACGPSIVGNIYRVAATEPPYEKAT